MSWHDETPWRRRHAKRLDGPDALEAIESKVRNGDLSIRQAIRLAYMVGMKDAKPKAKEATR